MSEFEQVGEVLEGYAETTQELLADWTPFVTGLSTTLAPDPSGQKAAAAEFPAFAKLVAGSVFKLAGQVSRTVTVLTSDLSEETVIGGYEVKKAATVLTLSLKGDLVSVTGKILPMNQVTIVPDHVPANAVTSFALEVKTAGIKARTYDGFVLAKDPAGVLVQEIPVSRTVG